MRALILDDDPTLQTQLSISLMSLGFQVLNAMSTMTGLAMARRGSVDLLVMSEFVEDKLSHSVALSAERHSPYVATILRTGRTDDDLPELYDLLPSLYGILGRGIPVDLIAKLGMSGVSGATRHKAVLEPIPFQAKDISATDEAPLEKDPPLILHPKLRIQPATLHPTTPVSARPAQEQVALSGSS